jgi:hypothetical protein
VWSIPRKSEELSTDNPSERKNVNNKFDELTKQMAQSVTRRAALKKFGVGFAGMALAAFGLADKAGAAPVHDGYCQAHNGSTSGYTGECVNPVTCAGAPSADCPIGSVPDNNNSKIKAYFGCGGILTPLDLRMKCNFTV